MCMAAVAEWLVVDIEVAHHRHPPRRLCSGDNQWKIKNNVITNVLSL